MTFAILKNAVRSRAILAIPESGEGRPERSRGIVFSLLLDQWLAEWDDSNAFSSSGPVRNIYSLLPIRIRSPCRMASRLTLVPLRKVPL
jgi:hypothetical protein